ncbi:MAG: lipid II:glycine glycyltransferase FemX [Pyrinomonadaceae bacterium]
MPESRTLSRQPTGCRRYRYFMANWELLTNETARRIWDENLVRLDGVTPFQMFAWGEYSRAMNWEPVYLAARDETGEITAMMLGLLRRYPLGTGLMWCAGGPVGDVKTWDESLQQSLLKATKLKRVYCRFRCDRERNIDEVLTLNNQNWMRSWFMWHSCWTMELDLTKSEPEMLAKCSRNWRRNLVKAQKNDLQIRRWNDPNVEEIVAAYADMETRKNLPEQFSREELQTLFERAGANLVCYRADDENGKLLALRACLVIGNQALDHLAVTTARGRELFASYIVFQKLLQDCRERGIKSYDLSGIDPHNNPGVFTFKRETGARPVEQLGEWDWASSGWLRWLGNFAIWQRHRMQHAKA